VLASFGDMQTRRPTRCRRHRLGSDVDTRHATCALDTCSRRAYYGEPNGPAVACGLHKLPSHVDVVSKRCEAFVFVDTPSGVGGNLYNRTSPITLADRNISEDFPRGEATAAALTHNSGNPVPGAKARL
jgi:hypothetical protein